MALCPPVLGAVGLLLLEPEQVEQLTDLVLELRGMAHREVPVERVVVAPSRSMPRDVPGVDEVGNDSLSRSLRDADGLGDVAQPHVGVLLEAEKDLRVARDEVPRAIRFRT